jgi:hypothetical protein
MNVDPSNELISAALDGEVVDLDALQAALALPESRATLAAFVLMRAAAAADRATPGIAFDARWLENAGRPYAWRLLGKRVPMAVAASISAVAVAGSFWLGTVWRAPTPTPAVPAAQLAPVSPAPPAGPTQAGNQVREQPPTPTRRVHFAPGEWRQGS